MTTSCHFRKAVGQRTSIQEGSRIRCARVLLLLSISFNPTVLFWKYVEQASRWWTSISGIEQREELHCWIYLNRSSLLNLAFDLLLQNALASSSSFWDCRRQCGLFDLVSGPFLCDLNVVDGAWSHRQSLSPYHRHPPSSSKPNVLPWWKKSNSWFRRQTRVNEWIPHRRQMDGGYYGLVSMVRVVDLDWGWCTDRLFIRWAASGTGRLLY